MAEKKRKRTTKTLEELQEVKDFGEVKDYEPAKVYEVGDRIRHKVWNDIGVVKEVGETEDGVKKMIVEFEQVGVKKLIMDYEPSST